ncbi:hypothetical protein [Roseibium sp.]|jgi:hypothetical protein|uniref:hypothetical protein n=1 Tax=Roseibium sp. TaxID=1936156 RepID=UPI003BADB67D
MTTIFAKMLIAAEGFLTAYRSDLTEHDAACCAKLKAGDAGVWICRPSGTSMITFPTPFAEAEINQLAAFQSNMIHVHAIHPGAHWYTFTVTQDGGIGHLTPVSATGAMLFTAKRIEEVNRRPIAPVRLAA